MATAGYNDGAGASGGAANNALAGNASSSSSGAMEALEMDPSSGASFFNSDYKRHDDLKQMLDSNKDGLKLEAMKRIISLVARGRAFGESRNVCNVHWRSDIIAGRMAGAAAVARLHTNERFLAAMEAARQDIARARAAGLEPNVDCAAEAQALAVPLP